jgi:hypothetical protein
MSVDGWSGSSTTIFDGLTLAYIVLTRSPIMAAMDAYTSRIWLRADVGGSSGEEMTSMNQSLVRSRCEVADIKSGSRKGSLQVNGSNFNQDGRKGTRSHLDISKPSHQHHSPTRLSSTI